MFLADRIRGEYRQTLIWESQDEIKIHAVAENNDSGIFSVDQGLTSCSVYGVRRQTGWRPEHILTAGRYVGRLVHKSPDGDLFVLAIQEHPYAIYAISLKDDNWESCRLFSDITSDIGERGISATVALDRCHIAGLSWSSEMGNVVRCVTPEGKVVGEWPAADGRIEFSPDSQWLSYLVETHNGEGWQQSRMMRRVDGSGECRVYSYNGNSRDRAYVGWVVSEDPSQSEG